VKPPPIGRSLLLPVVIGLVVLAHLAVAGYLVISPERWRARLEEAIEQQLAMPVRIERLELVDMEHALIHGLIVGTPELPSSQESYLAVDLAEMETNVLALLGKGAPVRSLSAKGVQARLTRELLDRLGEKRRRIRPDLLPKRVSMTGATLVFPSGALAPGVPEVEVTQIEAQAQAVSGIAPEYMLSLSARTGVAEQMRVEGKADLASGELAFTAECFGLKLGAELRDLLPPAAVEQWTHLRPEGRGDLTLQIEGNAFTGKFAPPSGSIRLAGAEITQRRFPYRVPDLVGKVSWRGNRVSLENLLGHTESSTVELSGQLVTGPSGVRPNLRIAASNVPLDEQVRRALAPGPRAVWDRFEPSGHADVTCYVMPGRAAQRGTLDLRVVVRCSDGAATFDKFPLPLSALSGEIIVTRTTFEMNGLRGKWRDSPVTVGGIVGWGENATRRTLHIEGSHFPINEELKKACPAPLADLLTQIGAQGDVSFEVDIDIGPARDANSPLAASFRGRAVVERGGFVHRWPIDSIAAEVEFSGAVPKKGPVTLQARVRRANARIKGFALTDGTVEIVTDGQTMKLRGLRAQLCGGEITGSLKFPGSHGGPADGSLDFRRVDLQEMLLSAKAKNTDMTGLMRGTVDLPASLPNGKPARAVLDMRIAQGDLYRIPPLLKLFDVLNLTGGDGVVTDARMTLYLLDKHVRVHKLRLTGLEAVPIFGQGTVGYDGALDLRFITGKGKNFITNILEKVPGVDMLVDFIRGSTKVLLSSVVQVTVTGTFSEPKGRMKPFARVTQEMIDFITEAKQEISPRHQRLKTPEPDARPTPGP